MPSRRAISCPCWRPASGPSKVDIGIKPAKARGVIDLVLDMRSDHEQSFRHAARIHAGARTSVVFGHNHPRAMACGDPGGANPHRTPPMTKDSTSKIAISTRAENRFLGQISLPRCASRAELTVDGPRQNYAPTGHIGHVKLYGQGSSPGSFWRAGGLVNGTRSFSS